MTKNYKGGLGQYGTEHREVLMRRNVCSSAVSTGDRRPCTNILTA